MPTPRQLVHSEWFEHALQSLGNLSQIETVLAQELYRLATYADLVPLAPGCSALRIYQTQPVVRDDGQLVRVLIYFVLRSDNSVELQHIEAVEENMRGGEK